MVRYLIVCAALLLATPAAAQVSYPPGVSSTDMQAAIAAAVPLPANTAPKAEVTGAATGTVTTRYALEDHQHPRLTSTTYTVLDGAGQATVTFSRSFANKPGLNLTETDAVMGSQPLVLRAIAWVQDGQSRYTGVTIQGSRAQMLPQINPLAGTISLLSGVVTGVNTNVVTPLTQYNVFGGTAVGATVSVIAVARSDVPSN